MNRSKLTASLGLSLLAGLFFSGCASDGTSGGGSSTTPLMWAAQEGNLEKVKSLVAQGADVNAHNINGVSVLAHTAYYKRVEVARFLMENGAKPANEAERGEIDQMLGTTAAARSTIVQSPSAPGAASAVSAPPGHKNHYSPAESPDDYAVVIGIENYADLPPATYAVRDAAAVRRFIAALGVPQRNIIALTDGRATKTGIEKIIESWLPNNVSETSRVYVYYSGHGAPDARTGEAYLVPSDGDPQYLAQTGYPLKRLYAKLGQLKAKSVLVALDSCFSGAGGRSVLAKGMRPLVAKVDIEVETQGKISVISASAGDQISGTNDEAGYGLFTYNFLRGLNGAAKDERGRVTLKSLYAYLKPRVQDDARRGNNDQTPQLRGGGEDLVLRAK